MILRHVGDGFTVNEAAKLAGTTPGILRVWEMRYGWPTPRRHANGYRLFTRPQIDDIRRLVQILKRGGHPNGKVYTPSDIIVDGLPVWPPVERTAIATVWSCYEQLPQAPTIAGEAFRARLERALRGRDMPAVLLRLHEAPIVLRPSERTAAAWLPAYFGAREWERVGRPLSRNVADLIARLAGGYVVELLRARWETIEAATEA